MKRLAGALTLMYLLASGFPLAASNQKSSPKSLVGRWKLNVAKSAWGKIRAPKASTLVVTRDDATGLSWTAYGISADGESFSFSFQGAADGKDYPVKSPNKKAVSGFTRAYRKTGRTLHVVDKMNGAIIQTSTITISTDGQTITINFVRMASDTSWTEVLDRIR